MRDARRPQRSAIVVCLMAIAWSPVAAAAPPEAEHAAAVESFRRGTQLVETGKLDAAIEAFRDALQHEPSSVGARLDLADCYEKVGALAPAWREYTLANGYAQKANDARAALARSSASHLEPRLLRVTLIGQAAPSMKVRVDGEAVPAEIAARGAFAVAPGAHRIELVADGKRARVLDVDGVAGETRSVSFALVDEPLASDAPARSEGSAQKTWGLVLGGFGLSGVVVGSVTGLVAASKKRTLQTEATDPTIGASRFYDDRATAKTFAAVSTASFVVGGAGLAAGALLFLTAPSPLDRTARLGLRIVPRGLSVDMTF